MKRLLLFLIVLLPSTLTAQWQRTNGLPASGSKNLLRYNQDSILCNIGSEVYLSTDDGQNWALIPQTGGVNLINAYTNGRFILMYDYYDSANELTYTNDFFQTIHKVNVPVKAIAYEFFVWNNYIHFMSDEGLFRSMDNGLNWQKINDQQFYLIQVLPDRILGFAYTQLYQSCDGGLSWDALPTLQPCGYPKGLLVHGDTLWQFAAGYQRSTDGGHTWEFAGSFGLHEVDQFLWHKGSIFARKNARFYRSDDQGSSWVLKILPADVGVVTQVISTEEALILSNYRKNAIYRSTDNGESWQVASR